jgi:hypothetical protein
MVRLKLRCQEAAKAVKLREIESGLERDWKGGDQWWI